MGWGPQRSWTVKGRGTERDGPQARGIQLLPGPGPCKLAPPPAGGQGPGRRGQLPAGLFFVSQEEPGHGIRAGHLCQGVRWVSHPEAQAGTAREVMCPYP